MIEVLGVEAGRGERPAKFFFWGFFFIKGGGVDLVEGTKVTGL